MVERQHQTFDIFYLGAELEKKHQDILPAISLIESNIPKIGAEPDPLIRQRLFSKIADFNEHLFSVFKNTLAYYTQQANQSNYETVHEYIALQEEDDIDWYKFISSRSYTNTIEEFSELYSSSKKEDLNLNHFYLWDYWLEPSINLSQAKLENINTFEDCINFVKSFFIQLGFEEAIHSIQFEISSTTATAARLMRNDQMQWAPKVLISKYDVSFQMGSPLFLSRLCHEIGHAIQGFYILNLTSDHYLPAHRYSETVSVIFEDMFLNHYIPRFLIKPFSMDVFRNAIALDRKETIARTLMLFDFQFESYQLFYENQFTPTNLSMINNALWCKYFGFEPWIHDNHSWQRYLRHLFYPFRERIYFIGQMISHELNSRFSDFEDLKKDQTIKNLIKDLSEKSFDTLQIDEFKSTQTIKALTIGLTNYLLDDE